jgi:ATP-dependent DNA helicase RecQ
VNDDLQSLLERHFGFSEFLPGQRQVVEALLAGHSAAAFFPTGGGKSLCYQLPALELDGLTLVVSPLIALMKDQIDSLIARGVRARRLDSTLSAEDYRDVVRELRGGELALLYVAPERFNNERFRGMIENLDIALFAVDEAHCISEWGHNFRPDYLKLARFVRTSRPKTPCARPSIARTYDSWPHPQPRGSESRYSQSGCNNALRAPPSCTSRCNAPPSGCAIS